MSDKSIEKLRYDNYAANTDALSGVANIAPYLRPPYEKYFEIIEGKVGEGSRVLELACGVGHVSPRFDEGHCEYFGIDILHTSLMKARQLCEAEGGHCDRVYVSMDIEGLALKDESFDTVICAGGLSYGDNQLVLSEIYRVLKVGGWLVLVDSLNDNPIYRINRYMHYIRGNRSLSTLQRMPDLRLINEYRAKFMGQSEVAFFGGAVWLLSPLTSLLGSKAVGWLVNQVDRLFKIRSSAFKFVLACEKIVYE